MYGREENSDPHYQGDWTDLFRSEDLKTWTFVHRFYENTHKDATWPDKTEDDMCPSFLPLFDKRENGSFTGKYLQLFIAHNRGCQYYIGTLEGETFIPEQHGRMSWNDIAYFAPEALIDDKNRHIIWTWLHGNPENDFEKYGWSGVFCFPRTVWYEDGALKMAPAAELDRLEYNTKIPTIGEDGGVSAQNGEVFRLKAVIQLVDVRVGPTDDDIMMINFLIEMKLPFFVVATKCDKLSKTALQKTLDDWQNGCFRGTNITVIPCSAVTGDGKDKVWNEIFTRL